MSPSDPLPALDLYERRVLGVLVEKQKTSKTADTYPMTLNALTTGCNQKSNRDPILNLSDDQVADALSRCQKKGLAMKVTGSRVDRWRHNLYDTWHVDKADLAVLAELLLRGPQTEGELRTRASRMDAIDDLDALRAVLKPLVERKFVVYLTAQERRGAMLTHGFHEPQELEKLRGHATAQPVAAPEPVAAAPAAPSSNGAAEEAIAEVKREVTDLRQRIENLEGELRALKQSLGA